MGVFLGSDEIAALKVGSDAVAAAYLGSTQVFGGDSYHADAVHFDGATYLTNASLITPLTSFYSIVRWFKTTQNAGEPTLYVVDPDDTVVPYEDMPNGKLDIEMSAGGQLFEGQTSSTYRDGAWHCEIFSIDASTGSPRRYRLYIDDVDITFGVLFETGASAFTIAGNGLKAQIGYDNTDSSGFFIGDLAEYRTYYGVSLLDGSGDIPLATRRLFIDGSSKPVDPAVATAALGTPGTILFSGDASTFATNQGTGGVFTTTGTLTNASSSPSD